MSKGMRHSCLRRFFKTKYEIRKKKKDIGFATKKGERKKGDDQLSIDKFGEKRAEVTYSTLRESKQI